MFGTSQNCCKQLGSCCSSLMRVCLSMQHSMASLLMSYRRCMSTRDSKGGQLQPLLAGPTHGSLQDTRGVYQVGLLRHPFQHQPCFAHVLYCTSCADSRHLARSPCELFYVSCCAVHGFKCQASLFCSASCVSGTGLLAGPCTSMLLRAMCTYRQVGWEG